MRHCVSTGAQIADLLGVFVILTLISQLLHERCDIKKGHQSGLAMLWPFFQMEFADERKRKKRFAE